jgi:endoglucanase
MKFEIKKGTNLGVWLSQTGSRIRDVEPEQFIVKKDIEDIAAMGFDHVRLPIDEKEMWDKNGKRNEDAFRLMENCIEWCRENNLRIIIDLHILRSHHFNAEEKPLWTDPAEQERFYSLWRDLSKSLKKYPVSLVAYELLNEAVADDPESWNELLANVVKVIRETEPERTIVIGSNKWQHPDTFDALKVPENDPNIILSFHFYEPLVLTHYNAGWNAMRGYTGPVHYPGIVITRDEYDQVPEEMKSTAVEAFVGKEFNKTWILGQWQQPLRKAEKLGLPLYCGEFGIIPGAPEEDGYRWYQDMIDLFRENGIAYANWLYKGAGWGLVDEYGNRRENKIRIISGK